MNTAMLGCGIWYSEDENCLLRILLYLRVAGGIGLLINFIELILLFYVHGGGSRVKLDGDNLEPFSCFVAICNLISTCSNISLLSWGSILVMGPLIKIWTDENNGFYPFKFCEYVPYLI